MIRTSKNARIKNVKKAKIYIDFQEFIYYNTKRVNQIIAGAKAHEESPGSIGQGAG